MKKNGSVTIKDIAQVLGISAKAVSTGLNNTGRLAPETRRKIQETAQKMGYTPNAAARALVTHRSSFIGVLLPFLNTSFFGNIIAGIEEVAGSRDFTLLLESLSPDDRDEERRRRTFARLQQRSVDALILYPQKRDLPWAETVRGFGVPVVQIMNHFPEFGNYAISVDNFAAGHAAAEHLIGLGHRHIGMLSHDTESAELIERRLGFEKALEAHGLTASSRQQDIHMSVDDGYHATLKLLDKHPQLTAIFAASDFSALGVVRAALELNRRIPDDLAILGFDDLEIAARQMIYPLSTMAQPKEQIGELAAQMVLDILAGKTVKSHQLQAPLIIRKTTGRKIQP